MHTLSMPVQSTVPASATAPPGTVAIVEYYRRDKDHYFMTGDSAEAAFIDAVYSATFQRTGGVFYAWLYRGLAPASAQPVCRFYSPLPLIDSHFYTAIASECRVPCPFHAAKLETETVAVLAICERGFYLARHQQLTALP